MKKRYLCAVLALGLLIGAMLCGNASASITVDFKGAVPNDVTGKWRWATANTEEYVLNWVSSYYLNFFEDDSEIHCIINYGDSTTTCVKVLVGELCVDVHQYVKGEEGDAKLMFDGDLLEEQWLPIPEAPAQEPEAQDQQEEPQDDGLFTFRGIPWWSTEEEVEKILYPDGASSDLIKYSDEDCYRLEGITSPSVIMGDEHIKGVGVKIRCKDLKVAGYTPTFMYADFIYPLSEDGLILRDARKAEFYFGWYTFESKDYTDIASLYIDLQGKLIGLYGEASEAEDKYHVRAVWNDPDGNTIQLLRNTDSTYITLGYIAHDADQRLDEMQAALDAENIAAEAAQREANAGDSSGL